MGVNVPPLRTVPQDTLAGELSQNAVVATLGKVGKDPLLQQNTVTRIDFSPAVVRVNHGLGRKPLGWFIVRATGAVPAIFEESSDASHVVFRSASASVCDVRFF